MISEKVILLILFCHFLSCTAELKKRDDYDDRSCLEHYTSVDGSTVVCFKVQLRYGFDVHKSSLKPTAVALVQANTEGRIVYFNVDRFISLDNKSLQERWFRFHLSFNGNQTVAYEFISKMSDIILYMGTDYAQSYEPIKYAYNPEYLKMNQLNDTTPPRDIPYNIYFIAKFKEESLMSMPRFGQAISSPGIYRMKIGSDDITRLMYDPLLTGSFTEIGLKTDP